MPAVCKYRGAIFQTFIQGSVLDLVWWPWNPLKRTSEGFLSLREPGIWPSLPRPRGRAGCITTNLAAAGRILGEQNDGKCVYERSWVNDSVCWHGTMWLSGKGPRWQRWLKKSAEQKCGMPAWTWGLDALEVSRHWMMGMMCQCGQGFIPCLQCDCPSRLSPTHWFFEPRWSK